MRRDEKDIDTDLERLRKMLTTKARTVAEIQESFGGVDRKTVYTWLRRLEDRHLAIVRVGTARPSAYRILGG